jgi:Trypsin-co-occurring domain 1
MAVILLKVPIDDTHADFMEVEIDRRDLGDQVELNADAGRAAVVAPFTLASALDRVTPALRTILGRFRTLDLAPDEIAMELGLKVGGEAGLVFTKGTAESTFTVTLTWRRPTG